MKIEINIRKRYTYAILLVLILGFSIFIAISQPAPTQGHPASEIRPGSFQEGDYIFPDTSQVGIGTTNPGSFKLYVNGKARADTPLATDPDDTVATKGYVDAQVGGGGLVLVAENTNDETFTQSDANAIQNFINNKGVITDAICCYTSGCSKIHPSYIHTGPSTIFLYAGSPGLVATYKIFCNSNVPSKRCAVGSVSTANCTCGWKILGQRYQ